MTIVHRVFIEIDIGQIPVKMCQFSYITLSFTSHDVQLENFGLFGPESPIRRTGATALAKDSSRSMSAIPRVFLPRFFLVFKVSERVKTDIARVSF